MNTNNQQSKAQETPTHGETLMTMIEKKMLTREQIIEQINNIISSSHQTGLEQGYDQALFDMGTQQICG